MKWWVKTRANQPAYYCEVVQIEADSVNIESGVLVFYRHVRTSLEAYSYKEYVCAYGVGEWHAMMPLGAEWPGHVFCVGEKACLDCRALHRYETEKVKKEKAKNDDSL